MVPRLALESGNARDFGELIRRRLDQHDLAFFRRDEEQVLAGEQHNLTVPVPAALPLARAVGEIDAREDAAVESIRVSLVHDEIVEIWFQSFRLPAIGGLPSSRDR